MVRGPVFGPDFHVEFRSGFSVWISVQISIGPVRGTAFDPRFFDPVRGPDFGP